MRKVMLLSLSLFLGLTLTVTAAMAWGPGLGQSFGMGQEFGCPDLPILGEKQFHKVQALEEAFLKEIEPLQQSLVKKEAELRTFESTPDADQAAVMAKEKEVWQIESKLHEKIVNATLEARRLLTPEQNTQLPDFSSGVVGERGFNPIMWKMWSVGC